ncbi:MAG: hypothetical protein JRG91_14830 [Deltaproteobacteria bacterium]|nr:hypothetical protein [Deltaproteobacteria bacterium]
MSGYCKTGKPGRIVGSSERQGPREDVNIPVNLERILLAAAGDDEFLGRFLSDPAGAAMQEGFDLTGSERAMLSALERRDLGKLVERFRPERIRKSRFARHVAAAVAGSMIISVVACDVAKGGGAGPDLPDAEVDADVAEEVEEDPEEED